MTNSSTAHPFTLKATLLAISSMTVMSAAIIGPALPQLAEAFAGQARVDLLARGVLVLPSLIIALTAPAVGAAVDRYGRRLVLVLSLILYSLAGSSGLWLADLTAILIGRAALGLSVAGLAVVSNTLLGDYFQGSERASFVGIQAAFIGFGGVAFVSAGGLLADVNWRAPFWVYLAALPMIPAVLAWLPEPAITAGSQAQSARGKAGLPLTWLALLYLTAFTGVAAIYIVPVQLPFFIMAIAEKSNTEVGLAISACLFVSALVSLNYGSIKARINYQAAFALCFGLIGVGCALLSLAATYLAVLVAVAVVGLGAGLLMPSLNLWAVARAPVQIRGRVMGGLSTAIYLGQFGSPLMIQPLLDAGSFGFAFLVSAGLVLLIAVGFGLAVLRSGKAG